MIFATFCTSYWIYMAVVSDSLKWWLIWMHLKPIYSKKPFSQQILNPRNASVHKKTALTCAEPGTERCMQDQGFQSHSDFW